MQVLLTGASGYAGGAIKQALQLEGLAVITAGRAVQDNLNLDLLHPETLQKQSLPVKLDALVHVAAAHEISCLQDPVASYTSNVTATRALLGAAQRAGVQQLVYISTFHVFGHPQGRLDETKTPLASNDYGLTHLLAEQIFMQFAKQHKLGLTILRPANFSGTPANWSSFKRWTLAPFDLVAQAINKHRIELHTDGTVVRNYISVTHLGQVALAAVQGKLPEIVHVTGKNWQIKDLAYLTATVVESLDLETTRENNIPASILNENKLTTHTKTIQAKSIPIILGIKANLEHSYEFCSNVLAAEMNMVEKMTNFLQNIAQHLLYKKNI